MWIISKFSVTIYIDGFHSQVLRGRPRWFTPVVTVLERTVTAMNLRGGVHVKYVHILYSRYTAAYY